MEIVTDENYLLLDNNEIEKYRKNKLLIIIISGFAYNILYLINNLVYDNIANYFDLIYIGSTIKNIFIIENIINITLWIFGIIAFYYLKKENTKRMKIAIITTYVINLLYSIVLLFIPWILIGDNKINQLAIYIPVINVLFNMFITIIFLIPNTKNASLILYKFTKKEKYYTISIITLIFEIFIMIIILSLGIQVLSLYYYVYNEYTPLVIYLLLCIIYIIYSINILKDKNNYINIILSILIIGLGLYILIYFSFGFNIINTIFIGNISSFAIFEVLKIIIN
jgi:hypothetical protein